VWDIAFELANLASALHDAFLLHGEGRLVVDGHLLGFVFALVTQADDAFGVADVGHPQFFVLVVDEGQGASRA